MKPILAALVTFALAVPCIAQTERPKQEASDFSVIAMVLGKKITAGEKDQLNGLIFGSLLEQYAKDNKLEPTQAELDDFVRRTEDKEKQQQVNFQSDKIKLAKELKSSSLSAQEREQKASQLKTIEIILKATGEANEMTKAMDEQMRPMKRQMAQQFVMSWKVNKALYAKYGGRVIFQQTGAEPIDAYRDFLRDQEKAGRFQIIDKQYESGFWRYFTSDAGHKFANKEDGAKLINTRWWMMEGPGGK